MKGSGATQSLEDFVIHILLPMGVVLLIIGMIVLMAQDFNINFPNPFG